MRGQIQVLTYFATMHSSLLLTLFLFLTSHWFCLLSQRPVPQNAPDKPLVFKGLTLHMGNGQKIQDGVLAIHQGRIVYSGPRAGFSEIPNAEVREFKDAHAYPGFILMDNILGLTETDALKPTHDFRETGEINPEVRACVAFNTDSKIIPTVRSNGILLVQSTPRGALLAGTSAVMRLDGWNWEDAAVLCQDGVHVYWPESPVRTRQKSEDAKEDPDISRKSKLQRLELFFRQAQAYAFNQNPPQEKNIHLEALKPVLKGTSPLYIHASGAVSVVEALDFFKAFGNIRRVLCGMPDTGRALDYIQEEKIPVILSRIHALPPRDDADYDLPYRMPAILERRGIPFALSYAGDMEAMGSRNLPFLAGTAVAFGLDYERAVAAISSVPAKILGIEKDYGSLEKGKSATFFISLGDALDMRTQDVKIAFIDGRPLDLDNHQKVLYRQYLQKYGLN